MTSRKERDPISEPSGRSRRIYRENICDETHDHFRVGCERPGRSRQVVEPPLDRPPMTLAAGPDRETGPVQRARVLESWRSGDFRRGEIVW